MCYDKNMNELQAAQQAILLLKSSKGTISFEDIEAAVRAYRLSDGQTDRFLTWIGEEDIKLETNDADVQPEGLDDGYLAQVAQYPLLDEQQERELAEKVRNGDAIAEDRLIRSNLRLVLSIARHYQGSLPFSDLVQEGNMGLLKAVRRYDPEKNVRFAYYARFWIRQAMSRAISQNHVIHLPVNLADTLKQIRRSEQQLEQQLGRPASDKEIAELLDLTEREVTELKSYTFDAVSVDKKMDDSTDITLADVIPSDFSMDSEMNHAMLVEEIHSALNTLNNRDRDIIMMRYGIDYDDSHTLQQIADKYSLSKERVRQIIDNGLMKLKDTGVSLPDFRFSL